MKLRYEFKTNAAPEPVRASLKERCPERADLAVAAALAPFINKLAKEGILLVP